MANVILNLQASTSWIPSKKTDINGKKTNYRKSIPSKVSKMKNFLKSGRFIDYIVRDEASFNSKINNYDILKPFNFDLEDSEISKLKEIEHFSGLYSIKLNSLTPHPLSKEEIKEKYKNFSKIDYKNQVVFTGVISIDNNFLDENNLSIPSFAETISKSIPELFERSQFRKEEIADMDIGFSIHTNTKHMHAHFYAFQKNKTRINRKTKLPDWNYKYSIHKNSLKKFKENFELRVIENNLSLEEEIIPNQKNLFPKMKIILNEIDNSIHLKYEEQKQLYSLLKKAKKTDNDEDKKDVLSMLITMIPNWGNLNDYINQLLSLVGKEEMANIIRMDIKNQFLLDKLNGILENRISSPYMVSDDYKNLTNKLESNTFFEINELATEINLEIIKQMNMIQQAPKGVIPISPFFNKNFDGKKDIKPNFYAFEELKELNSQTGYLGVNQTKISLVDDVYIFTSKKEMSISEEMSNIIPSLKEYEQNNRTNYQWDDKNKDLKLVPDGFFNWNVEEQILYADQNPEIASKIEYLVKEWNENKNVNKYEEDLSYFQKVIDSQDKDQVFETIDQDEEEMKFFNDFYF